MSDDIENRTGDMSEVGAPKGAKAPRAARVKRPPFPSSKSAALPTVASDAYDASRPETYAHPDEPESGVIETWWRETGNIAIGRPEAM